MGRRQAPEYKPHPLLEQLRPPLRGAAKGKLIKSIQRVGQLQPILVTVDDYILEGRARLAVMQELGRPPVFQTVSVWSGLGETPGSTPEEEQEAIKEILEELNRSWASRGPKPGSLPRRETHNSDSSRAKGWLINAIADDICSQPGPTTIGEVKRRLDLPKRKCLSSALASLVERRTIAIVDTIQFPTGGRGHLYWHP